jgi:hypothetical protein
MKYNDSKYPGSGDYERTRPRLNPFQVDKVSAALAANLTGEVDMFITLAATVNDLLLPAGVSFRLLPDPSTGSTVTGFAGGRAARFAFIHNVGVNNLVLADQDAGSEDENQILAGPGGDVTIPPNQSAILIYDGVSTRWRLVAPANP